MTQKPTASIRIFQPRPNARMRMFCFAYSGGSAQVFKDWSKHLPEGLEICGIQLPGRAGRFREPSFTSVDKAVPAIAAELPPFLNKPFILYGHSLGAMMAYEMARTLQARGYKPAHLIVSGVMSPREPSLEPPIYHLPEPEFRQKVKEMNGTPREILEHEELMDLVLPILKADFTMADTYAYKEGPMLTCPITGQGGVKDPHTNETGITTWGDYTTGSFSYKMFPGDHFFINSDEAAVMAHMNEIIQSIGV